MSGKKSESIIRPIIFDEDPFNVLVSLAGSGGIRSLDEENLSPSFSCFVLKANTWYGLPGWDKGDPDVGKIPQPDFWTQLLFIPTFSSSAENNRLYNKVGDRTVCQIFKRGRHLATFAAACKTTRNEPLDNLLDDLGIPDLQSWQTVVWTPEFVAKCNKLGKYSSLKWWWSLPEGERQIETQARVFQMFRTFGTNPLELEYDVDPGLLNLDTLEQEEKRKFKRLVANQNQPILLEGAAQAFIDLAAPPPRQIENQ